MPGWDASADFVSVGSGMAGCASALAAADAGLETIIVEKAPLLGGSTVYSYGILWIPNNHLEKRAGIADSTDDGRQCGRKPASLGGGRH